MGALRGSAGSSARLLALAVIQDDVLFVTELALLEDAVVKFLQVVLGEAVILKELLNFVVYVLGELWALVAILHLELVNEEPLELLTLLNVEQTLLASLAHLRSSCGCTITLILFGSHR